MRTYTRGASLYTDFEGAEVPTVGSYYTPMVPARVVAVGTIANSANADLDFGFSGWPVGYYQVSIAVITEMADNTWRELRFAFSLYWSGSVITLQATPTAVAGSWNSSGLAGTITVSSSTTLRVNVANSSGQSTANNGSVYLTYGRRSP